VLQLGPKPRGGLEGCLPCSPADQVADSPRVRDDVVVRLQSVRDLKQELYEPLHFRGGLLPQEAPAVSLPAGRAEDVARVQPTLALGIAPNGPGDYRLAVRVQHRDLLRSARLDAIYRAARGEVDVRYIGRLAKQDAPGKPTRERPLRVGASVGHYAITAGTIGAFVRVPGEERARILSNNHVLADENRGNPGDEILQPGRLDGGRSGADRIGALELFVALEMTAVNEVDAAIAMLDADVEIDPQMPGIGRLQELAAPEEAHRVVKIGRTTGQTTGYVSAIEVDNVVVEFSTGSLRFDGQLEVSGTAEGPFSLGGDSGSLVVTADKPRALGLLFAGSDQGGPEGFGLTYANPIASVFDRLGIDSLW